MCHSQRTNKNEEIHDFFLYSKKTLFFFPNLTIFFFIIALLKVPTGWIFFYSLPLWSSTLYEGSLLSSKICYFKPSPKIGFHHDTNEQSRKASGPISSICLLCSLQTSHHEVFLQNATVCACGGFLTLFFNLQFY